MSLRILCGQKGHGKTLRAIHIIGQAVKAGRPTYTNIKLRPECPFADKVYYIDDRECMVWGINPITRKYEAFWHYTQYGAVVVLDEADSYFDSADHAQMEKDFKNYHKQLRHIGHDLVYIVQKVPNLNIRIRRLTDSFVVCEWNYRSDRSFKHLPIKWSRFLFAEFEEYPFRPAGRMTSGYWTYEQGSKYFNYYWTKQLTGDTSFYSPALLREMGLLEARHELTAEEAVHDLAESPISTATGNPFTPPNGDRGNAARVAAKALYQALIGSGNTPVAGKPLLAVPPMGQSENPDTAQFAADDADTDPTFHPDDAGEAFRTAAPRHSA